MIVVLSYGERERVYARKSEGEAERENRAEGREKNSTVIFIVTVSTAKILLLSLFRLMSYYYSIS